MEIMAIHSWKPQFISVRLVHHPFLVATDDLLNFPLLLRAQKFQMKDVLTGVV
jgi:hypothetical protein